MEMYWDSIGKRSDYVKNVIERGAVKKFAEAIGNLHPIFIDEDFGRKSRFGTNIAPPTFPRTFNFGEVEGLYLPDNLKGVIHGSHAYDYKQPLLVGQEVLCYTVVKNYFEKQGKLGKMGFLILEEAAMDLDGTQIFTSECNYIISETVREQVTQA